MDFEYCHVIVTLLAQKDGLAKQRLAAGDGVSAKEDDGNVWNARRAFRGLDDRPGTD
jgi:hypothetical protein